MFIYKIKEVEIYVSLREHADVTFAENDTAAYIPCLGLHKKLILTVILLKFSQTNLKIMYNQKIEQETAKGGMTGLQSGNIMLRRLKLKQAKVNISVCSLKREVKVKVNKFCVCR